MSRGAFVLVSWIAALATASLGALGTAAPPECGADGVIVFYSERDGNAEIYRMNPDGTGLERLTTNASNEFTPDWSPDGTRIVFESDRDDPRPVTCFPDCMSKLYVMDSDGSNERRLMDLPGSEGHPDWSPDGRSIVFNADRDGDGKNEIYVMSVELGVPRLVLGDGFDDAAPDWSPSGEEIAFMSDHGAGLDLFVIKADGTGLRTLVDSGENDYFPDWSPDGKEILFFSARWPSIRQDICVVGADGSGLRRLTNTPRTVDESAQWSPDGTRIVFQSDRDGNFEIYSMNRDGSNPVRLTRDPGGDYWPDWWMPLAALGDGRSATADRPIAFVSTRDGLPQIYVMSADGSDPLRLTNEPYEDYYPAWSPNGTQIAYYAHLTEQSWTIVVMNGDGSGRQEITHGSGCAVCSFGPYWSPDGRRIGFTIEPNPVPTCEIKKSELGIANADGTNCRRLTENDWIDLFYGWSPDGASVLFVSDREGKSEVYLANTDVTHERRITPLESTNQMPAWSPDGTRIAFVSDRDGNDEIYVMDASGTNVTRVTSDPAHDWMPAWSPDGSELLFSSDRDGRELEVYATSLDGKDVRRLTSCPGYDYEAVWRQ